LLINPEIRQREFELEKQQLFLAYDLSNSLKYLEVENEVVAFAEDFRNNEAIRERFEIREFGFGKNLFSLQQGFYCLYRESNQYSCSFKRTGKIKGF
jgi:hypothetical protein